MTFHRLWLALPLLTACALEDKPAVGEATEAITGDQAANASQWQRDRAVRTDDCTATKISARFALTSAHCLAAIGSPVRFYSTGPGADAPNVGKIAAVHRPPGVSASACLESDCDDNTGHFADIAVIELTRITPPQGSEAGLEGAQATLAWVYPGYGYDGVKVGAGLHNDGAPGSNPNKNLRQHPDETTSDDDDTGAFDTRADTTDDGDSGGPFYYDGRVLGTLFGVAGNPFNTWNKYTSVPHHLSWILSKIEYTWRGQPPRANTMYTGTIVQSLATTEAVCQYACEKTNSCQAYNFLTSALPASPNCNLYGNVTGVNTSAGAWRAALKHGSKQSNANDVVGMVRVDNVSSVFHKALNGNIHVLSLDGGSWSGGSIDPTNVISGTSGLSVYKRAENVDAIVFRSSTNRIIQILRTSSGWNDETDLTAATSAEPAAGTPTGYVRSDGVSAIVFRGATTGHIWEIRRGAEFWIATDLTQAAGSSVVASSDPIANVRADGFSSVVFRSGTTIVELFKAVGANWGIGFPALASAPPATDRPFPYTKKDGTTAIVYRQASTDQIVELTLSGSTWSFQHRSSNAAGAPVAYVRNDGADTILFRNNSNQIIQVTAATTNLTTATGAPPTATNPMAWVRSDKWNSVLFEDSANHVREFFVVPGGSWAAGDITVNAGENP